MILLYDANYSHTYFQYEVLAGYGEDGAMYQKSRQGIPAINLGIPTRYLHSHNSVIDLNDYKIGVKLVEHIINDLSPDKISSIIN